MSRVTGLLSVVVVCLWGTIISTPIPWMTTLAPAWWTGVAQAQVRTFAIEVSLPQLDLFELESDEAAIAVNNAIHESAMEMIRDLALVGNVWGGYEVHLDRDDVLSVTIFYSGYTPPMAHPISLRASVTADPRTGRVYSLADLFEDERYIDILSEAVALDIEEQELPLLAGFDKIAPDQDFYLTERHLVLYYQLYELAPYAWGFPEFEIPLESLRGVAKEEGPIAVLLGIESSRSPRKPCW